MRDSPDGEQAALAYSAAEAKANRHGGQSWVEVETHHKMSTFIDRHPLKTVPRSVQHRLHVEAAHGLVDPSGARPLAHWVEDGVIYCIVQAPDLTAAREHHAARDLAYDDMHQIPDLGESRPLSQADKVLINETIVALWHADEDTFSLPPSP